MPDWHTARSARDYRMKEMESRDLQDTHQSLVKTVRRAIRRPRKSAPAPDALRGWAKSSVKSRNKS